MTPSSEIRFNIGRVTVHLQCNLLSCMFGFALFTNSVSFAVGPLGAIFLISASTTPR